MRLPVMPPVAPMLAKPVKEIPRGPLSFEPKWDGFRSIVFRDGDEVELGSRNERPLTRYFPELVEAAVAVLPDRCVLDGEIVVPDAEGRRLDFEALLQRIHPAASRVRLLAEQTPAVFVAFDLLALDNVSYLETGFAERRDVLEQAMPDTVPPFRLTPATRDRDLAARWFSQFEGAGLDGIVAKPLDGEYEPDKRVMFKVKHERTADCVVAGYRLHKSGPDAIGSLRSRGGNLRHRRQLAGVGEEARAPSGRERAAPGVSCPAPRAHPQLWCRPVQPAAGHPGDRPRPGGVAAPRRFRPAGPRVGRDRDGPDEAAHRHRTGTLRRDPATPHQPLAVR